MLHEIVCFQSVVGERLPYRLIIFKPPVCLWGLTIYGDYFVWDWLINAYRCLFSLLDVATTTVVNNDERLYVTGSAEAWFDTYEFL